MPKRQPPKSSRQGPPPSGELHTFKLSFLNSFNTYSKLFLIPETPAVSSNAAGQGTPASNSPSLCPSLSSSTSVPPATSPFDLWKVQPRSQDASPMDTDTEAGGDGTTPIAELTPATDYTYATLSAYPTILVVVDSLILEYYIIFQTSCYSWESGN